MKPQNKFALFVSLLGILALTLLLETVSNKYLSTLESEIIKEESQKNSFDYLCAGEKTIKVTITPEDSKAIVQTDDGRLIILSLRPLESNVMYTNADESFILETTLNGTASITEGTPKTQTYSDCIVK